MTPREFKAIRLRLGMTQAELGRVLGLKPEKPDHSVRMWETGRRPISGPVALCLSYMSVYGTLG